MNIQELHKALTILLQEQPKDPINVAHDQIWAGNYRPELLSDTEKSELEKLGWFEDQDSWSHFI